MPIPVRCTVLVLCALLVWPLSAALGADAGEALGPSSDEAFVCELINRYRADPLGEAARLGVDVSVLSDRLEAIRAEIEAGLAPLSIHPALQAAAEAHVVEIVAGDDEAFSRAYPDRFREAGYLPQVAGEGLAAIGFGRFLPPEVAATILAEQMFLDEFSKAGDRPIRILNPAFRDVGVGLAGGDLVLVAGAAPTHVYVLDVGYGLEPAGPGPYVSGRVYVDLDADGEYGPGEGVAGARLLLTWGIESAEVETLDDGTYVMALEQAFPHVLLAWAPGLGWHEDRVRIHGGDGDKVADFAFPPQVD